jgi:hypothetical protein
MKRRLRVMLLHRLLPPLEENTLLFLKQTFDSAHQKHLERDIASERVAIVCGVQSVYDAIRDGKIP